VQWTAGRRQPRHNAVAVVYDRLAVSLLGGRIKHAMPIEWRVATRRWLSKAGR
jgi:hypothetical protein